MNNESSSGAGDVWSAGVVMYTLLCGFPPFYDEEIPALFDQIMHARYEFQSPWWDSISRDARDLIDAMLIVDPARRITAADVLKSKFCDKERRAEASGESVIDVKTLFQYSKLRKLHKATRTVKTELLLGKAIEAFRQTD